MGDDNGDKQSGWEETQEKDGEEEQWDGEEGEEDGGEWGDGEG